jgi:hypothetical protein
LRSEESSKYPITLETSAISPFTTDRAQVWFHVKRKTSSAKFEKNRCSQRWEISSPSGLNAVVMLNHASIKLLFKSRKTYLSPQNRGLRVKNWEMMVMMRFCIIEDSCELVEVKSACH